VRRLRNEGMLIWWPLERRAYVKTANYTTLQFDATFQIWQKIQDCCVEANLTIHHFLSMKLLLVLIFSWTVLQFLFSFKIQTWGRSKLSYTMIIHTHTWLQVSACSFLKCQVVSYSNYSAFSASILHVIFGWFLLVSGCGWFDRWLLLLMLWEDPDLQRY